MKSITMTTPQTEALNADEISRKTIDVYRTMRGYLKAISPASSRVPGYCEQNLLDENMGPEVRRMRW